MWPLHFLMDTYIMDTCIMYTCIKDTCIKDTCIMDTCIMDTTIRIMGVGHTAWAPKGREGRSQAGPKAPQDRSWAPEGRKTSSVRLILPSSRVLLPWCNNRNQLLESTICGKIVHTIDQPVGLNYCCIGPIAGLVWACKLVYGKNTWQWKLLLFTLLTN